MEVERLFVVSFAQLENQMDLILTRGLQRVWFMEISTGLRTVHSL